MPLEEKIDFKTSHLGVVAWLKYNDLAPTEIVLEGDTACWLFRRSDRLDDLVEEYQDSRALVNPKIYNRIFSNTKLDMFKITMPDRAHKT